MANYCVADSRRQIKIAPKLKAAKERWVCLSRERLRANLEKNVPKKELLYRSLGPGMQGNYYALPPAIAVVQRVILELVVLLEHTFCFSRVFFSPACRVSYGYACVGIAPYIANI